MQKKCAKYIHERVGCQTGHKCLAIEQVRLGRTDVSQKVDIVRRKCRMGVFEGDQLDTLHNALAESPERLERHALALVVVKGCIVAVIEAVAVVRWADEVCGAGVSNGGPAGRRDVVTGVEVYVPCAQSVNLPACLPAIQSVLFFFLPFCRWHTMPSFAPLTTFVTRGFFLLRETRARHERGHERRTMAMQFRHTDVAVADDEVVVHWCGRCLAVCGTCCCVQYATTRALSEKSKESEAMWRCVIGLIDYHVVRCR